ncbi:E3 ubiquitin protein ligase DRIP2 [Hirschfeldia incana]|nr:E3 ubiquitin protein ligase DRIP2 [Hirschfeldia incana]
MRIVCRKCIYEKITEDEIECCPVCDIDLGGAPLEKLRPDHILQDLRAKIFPLKRKRDKAPEITLPARRKERSISSLVVDTPRVVPAQTGTTTGKRTKSLMRKDVRRGSGGSFTKRAVKKEEESGDDHHTESASSPETLKKFTQKKRQAKKSSYAEPNQSLSNRRNKDVAEPWDSLHLINFLVDVANGTKPSSSQGLDPNSEHGNASHNDVQGNKTKTKDHKRKCKLEEEISTNGDPTTTETAPLKRTRRTRRKRSSTFGDSGTPPLVPDAESLKPERRNGPVWFSLVASNNQEGETSLPQIPANYLRIRDGNIPVSFIQKYLMRKLDLKSETEVEIRCMGEPVIPTLQLHSLVELWLQTTTSKHERVAASIGSSAKEFVMVLVYARKLPECNN